MESDIDNLYNMCIENPKFIFRLISMKRFDVVEKLINDNQINVNMVDCVGNHVVTRLLKARQYDLVFVLMKKRNWHVNHKNVDGDTFGHILAHDNSCWAIKCIEQLSKKKNYLPNTKNNKGETILDNAVKNNYLFTAIKVIEDKRFDSMDISTFKNLCNSFINDKEYGKYTKINTLEVIVKNCEKKDLDQPIVDMIDNMNKHMDTIKKCIMNNDLSLIKKLINNY